MPIDHRATLSKIKRFDQLIAYLRDQMRWPIANGEAFEDLTFEYTPEELGIDAKNAAKIQEIKRLRPLSPRQPWGIFFVKFEPKRLPVVALRRILSQVALKKRASANSAERAAWAADDLLFVSNYGEGDERQISFAHFSRAQDGHELPTLKVLGWDNLDTALHLDAVARELTEHLVWPDDDSNTEAWRTRWRSAFTLRHREVVSKSKDLSIRLAELARNIRDRIKAALAIETDKGPLTKLMKAFREALVHDLDADGFADMYAQTIAYGLLSARIADPHKKTADDFAAHMRTNPFLRELMETFLKVGGRRGKAGGPGIDFDELGVAEVVELLDDANMEAVVRDFGDRNRQEDPVIHFYELFLKEYDAKKRMQRGVFYTPRPVVSYIVRSVDELLRTQFGLDDGLADTTTWGEMVKRHKDLQVPEGVSPEQDFVQILDPATGTGTFLVEVIDLIHKTLVAKWERAGHGHKEIDVLWNDYVPEHLLTRLHGYELLMAPYAIAHLKIGLKLYETGYRFGTDGRARVYLTNALEPAHDHTGAFSFVIPALAHEAQAVNDIKRHQRFTAVVGNPPYSNFGQLNQNSFISGLLNDYKRGLDEKKLNLDDDFIKFIRLAHSLILASGTGLIGVITNHTFLDGVGHRVMRERLLKDFSALMFTDLHGNARRGERTPSGDTDENVFDIQQGVAVSLLVLIGQSQAPRGIRLSNLWGTRTHKYDRLLADEGAMAGCLAIIPAAPMYLFRAAADSAALFASGLGLQQVFPFHSTGIETQRDDVAVHFSRQELRAHLELLRSSTPESFRARYDVGPDGRDWTIADAKRDVLAAREPAQFERHFAYRALDSRWTFLSGRSKGFVAYPRWDFMRHLGGKNFALITVRQMAQDGEWNHVWVTNLPFERCLISNKTREANYGFLALRVADGTQYETTVGMEPTLSTNAFRRLKGGRTAVSSVDEALEVAQYAYGLFSAPSYRALFVESLRREFPRVFVPTCHSLFSQIARFGGELVALHLFDSSKLDDFITTYLGPENPKVVRVGWSDATVWLDAVPKNKDHRGAPGTVGFRGVSEAIWNFHIGGYRVCEKWLKDRKGLALSEDDIVHYQRIVVVLTETIRLMKEIDEAIEKHGGWPGAFASSATATAEEVVRSSAVARAAPEPMQYDIAPSPQRKVAELDPASSANQPENTSSASVGDSHSNLICLVRQLFSDGNARLRDEAIQALAVAAGFGRVDAIISGEIDGVLGTAVRRGILENASGRLTLLERDIEAYDRNFLKAQFLASLGSRAWTERDDAIRAFARWMGYRRTGAAIDEVGRSLINGLLRERRLESNETCIRRSS